ncbi:protein c-Fos-like [Physella acuta]|uniref:protein c-Fos-like n=1 Tax=Physella acuta TaxID=109671 RepID=UPI0027DB9FA4|nr:protein c-Fos-like [Physella acuta]
MSASPGSRVDLKSGLRCSIMAKRRAQGLADIKPEFNRQEPVEMSPEEREKRERRREQNRRAAQRCRTKKRMNQFSVIQNFENIFQHNVELRQEVATLRQERDGLQKVLQALLNTCTCQNKMAANVPQSHQLTSLKQMSFIHDHNPQTIHDHNPQTIHDHNPQTIHDHNPQTIHAPPDTESSSGYPAALVQSIQHLASNIQQQTSSAHQQTSNIQPKKSIIQHPTPAPPQVEPNELFPPKDYPPSCADHRSSGGKRPVFASSVTQICPDVQGPSAVLLTDTGKPSYPQLCQLSPDKPSYLQLSADKPSYPKLCQLLNSHTLLTLTPESYTPDSNFLLDPPTATSRDLSRDFRNASTSSDGSYHDDATSLQQEFRSVEVPDLDMDDVFVGGAPVYDVNNNVPYVADTDPAGEGLGGEEDVLHYISDVTVTMEDVGSFFNHMSGGDFDLSGSAEFNNDYSSY